MWQRLLPSAVCAACMWGCKSDGASSSPPGPSPPSYAGSCNHEAQGVCDEYAANNATAMTPGQCTSAGGAWTGGQCPLGGRTGVCAAATPATRTYAYSDAAATSLMSTCPAGKFVKIAGPATTGGTGVIGGMGGTGGTMTTPDAATDQDAGP